MELRAKQPRRWVSPAALKIAAWVAASIGLALAGRWPLEVRMPLEVRIPLACALIVIAAIVIVRAVIGWLGPLFLYDVIRTSRRGQPAGLRIFYAALLLTMLLVVGAIQFQGEPFVDLMVGRTTLEPRRLAEMASGFFAGIMTVQFIIILLVTPLYVAPAIAEEKERRSLEFLLTTELSDRAIVLGMLGARLGAGSCCPDSSDGAGTFEPQHPYFSTEPNDPGGYRVHLRLDGLVRPDQLHRGCGPGRCH